MAQSVIAIVLGEGALAEVQDEVRHVHQRRNELLTRVGPGTPCKELLRWYWHPIAATVQLNENPVRRVRLLGEDLTLYRDRSGAIGLMKHRV
jgi:5,5'-dehydrodivanillate O-demethylase